MVRLNGSIWHLTNRIVNGWIKEAYPSALCIDKQSFNPNPVICEFRGIDVNKRVNGCKRQLVVDTQGRLWVVAAHTANQADGPSGRMHINHPQATIGIYDKLSLAAVNAFINVHTGIRKSQDLA